MKLFRTKRFVRFVSLIILISLQWVPLQHAFVAVPVGPIALRLATSFAAALSNKIGLEKVVPHFFQQQKTSPKPPALTQTKNGTMPELLHAQLVMQFPGSVPALPQESYPHAASAAVVPVTHTIPTVSAPALSITMARHTEGHQIQFDFSPAGQLMIREFYVFVTTTERLRTR
jgi:hypothetical protein